MNMQALQTITVPTETSIFLELGLNTHYSRKHCYRRFSKGQTPFL